MHQLDLFTQTLPARPFATDDFTEGLYKWPRVEALTKRYVQANPEKVLRWMAFDIDRAGGAYDWQFRNCPAPNIAVENPANRHAHLLYGLGLPVLKTPEASVKALRYAAAVEQGLRVKLDGDPSYAAFTCKNPLSRAWNVQTWQEDLYDLDWLADYVDLQPYQDARKRLPAIGLGRNVTMFEDLRRWSYRAIRQMDWPDLATWRVACLTRAAELNTFAAPLPITEIRSTAKSVALWTWHHFTPGAFSAIQRERSRLGNAKKVAMAMRKRQMLLVFMEQTPGISVRSLARIHALPESTARRLVRHSPYQY